MRCLAERYRGLGREVMAIDEDAVWGERRVDRAPVDYTTASSLFYDLLHSERDAGGCPPPDQVVQVFEQLVNEALDRSAIWLQDWCWSDLLGMLGWDHQAVRVTLQQLQKIAAALAPRVIYLRVDPSVALLRALEERGPRWFNRHATTPFDGPVTATMVDNMAALSRRAESARIGALAGWATTSVDAAAPHHEVLEAIWQELEQPQLRSLRCGQ